MKGWGTPGLFTAEEPSAPRSAEWELPSRYLPFREEGGVPLLQPFPQKGHMQEKLISPKTPGLSVPTAGEERKEECASLTRK